MASGEQMLLSLPNETLTTVFQYLGQESLITLVGVCRRLQGVGERILYSNVIISDIADESLSVFTPNKTLSCCTTIARRPHLASVIRSFHVRWNREGRQRFEGRLAFGVIPCLRHVLQLSTQLESLELHLAGFRGSYEEVLEGCAFQLRVLSLSGPTDAPTEWFLHTQPAVLHLHLGDQHQPLRLAPPDLPVLETFRGDPPTAASILASRPVYGLALSGHVPSEECLRAFASASTPIRCLDLASLSITPTHLLNLSKHLTAVECLRMKLALRHTLHFTFSGMVSRSFISWQTRSSLICADSSDAARGLNTCAQELP